MSRWIEIDTALIKTVSVGGLSAKALWKRIMQQPTIDLVRCKECKHWDRAIDESGTIERFNFSECTKGHYGNGLGFYCADGEREGE